MESLLSNYLEIGAVVLLLIIILGFLNLYITIPKKLKHILNFLITLAAVVWLLRDLGLLNGVINSITSRVKTVLK